MGQTLLLIGKVAHSEKIVFPGSIFPSHMIDVAHKAKQPEHWVTLQKSSDRIWHVGTVYSTLGYGLSMIFLLVNRFLSFLDCIHSPTSSA